MCGPSLYSELVLFHEDSVSSEILPQEHFVSPSDCLYDIIHISPPAPFTDFILSK